MDAVEYLKQKNRMTNNCTIARNICPLAIENNNGNLVCANRDTISLGEAVATVENWAKEHPVKTYKSVFLEKFPDAKIGKRYGLYRDRIEIEFEGELKINVDYGEDAQ